MIELRNIKKNYGKFEALKGISLVVNQGTCFGLIGPNGAGKTTLMKILCGIIENFDGDATIFDLDLKKEKTKIKKILGYVPQEICLEEKLSAEDNLKFFGSMYGLKGKTLDEKIHEVLRLVGLHERRDEAIEKYSGGMKRRINIACALLHDPKFIVMDEPTVGVDPQSRNYIFEIIRNLKKSGKTIIYSSHYMEEVESLCDGIAIVDHGNVLETGNIEDILERYSKTEIYVEGEKINEESLSNIGAVTKKKDGYLIRTEDLIDGLKKTMNEIEKSGGTIHKLEIKEKNLEQIFFDMTGSELRD